MLRYLPYLLVIALWIYAFVDCLVTPAAQVRGVPKMVWVLVILFFGEVLVGPVLWLVVGRRRGRTAVGGRPGPAGRAGRDRGARRTGGRTGAGRAGADRGRDPDRGRAPRWRRGRHEVPPRPARVWVAPDDNPDFLRSLDELIKKRNRQDGPSEGE